MIFQTKALQLQYSCIRLLYDNFFHEWKLIPLSLIQKSFGTSFKFHSNLLFKSNKTKFFPFFFNCFELKKTHVAMITFYGNTFGTMEVSKRIMLLFIFQSFPTNIPIMFLNVLVAMDPLKIGINLRDNTNYMQDFVLSVYN